MRSLKWIVIPAFALTLVVALSWCSAKKKNPVSPPVTPLPLIERLLPASNAVAGWTRSVSGKCLQGVAQDCTSLYGTIDGGANVYLDRTYKASSYQGYFNGTDTLCLEIYDQGSADSARSVFNHYTFSSDYDTLSGLGDTAKVDTFGWLTEWTKSKYFVRMYFYNRTVLQTAKNLGKVIIDSIAANP